MFTEIIEKNFPNERKEFEIQVTDDYRTPNEQRSSPRHILMDLPDIHHKTRILKAVREKQRVTNTGRPIRITADST